MGDLVVRGAGALMILISLVNCGIAFSRYEPGVQSVGIEQLLYAIVTAVICVALGLVLIIKGENPDRARCNQNRIKGGMFVGGGVVAAIAGVVISIAISSVSKEVGFAIIARGLIVVGLASVLYGLLSAVTGYDPRELGMSRFVDRE